MFTSCQRAPYVGSPVAPACSPQPTRTPHAHRAQSPKFPHEIHRRSLWQVLEIYLAASWGAPQVVDTVVETANLPEWLPGMALVLLIIGLPVVLGTAFVQGGTKPASTTLESSDESPEPGNGGTPSPAADQASPACGGASWQRCFCSEPAA